MDHLDEVALEALATGRQDLLSAAARDHLASCDACRELVESEREDARDATVALRRASPRIDDLDAMISRAMQAVPAGPTKRSLWIGATVGGLAAAALAMLAMPSASVSGVTSFGRQGVTIARATDSLVGSLVPGGWAGVAVVGLVVALLLAIPVRFLLGERKHAAGSGMITGVLALALAIGVSAPAFSAHAYRLEGTWPEPQPTVTLDVDQQPTSEALRLATEAAGLGVVARMPDDPPVTLHVRDVPIGDVVSALLGDANVVVIPGDSLVTVRPDAHADIAPPPPPAPAAPAVPAVPAAPPAPPAGLADRVTFGSDVEVGEGEVVRGVYTMGGDAQVDGRAFGDVVTMGGDADVRGEVVGNVTTMGGDIKVRDGARVHGDLNAMGGHIDVADGASVFGQTLSASEGHGRISVHHDDGHRASPDDDGADVVRWGLWHVLLFLLGLVMMGTARGRFEVVRSELSSRPIRSALGGFFGLLAGGVLCVVLAVTIIGIPVSAVLGTLLTAALCVGWSAAAWWLGGVLPIAALKGRPVLQLAVGVGALFLVSLAPKIGMLISVIAALAGLGAAAATRLGGKPRQQQKRPHIPTGPFARR